LVCVGDDVIFIFLIGEIPRGLLDGEISIRIIFNMGRNREEMVEGISSDDKGRTGRGEKYQMIQS